MNKIKVGVIFGGKSTEHDVSIVSGTSIIKNMNKEKYEIFPIYIDRFGEWFKYNKNILDINVLKLGEKIEDLVKIENVMEFLKSLDVVFPVLHGLYGEDGTIQGLFELLGIPYVGCRVLGSSLCMDKAYTKAILKQAKIPQVKYMYVKKIDDNKFVWVDDSFDECVYDGETLGNLVNVKLGFPVFIKPSNSGSSIGVNKAENIEEVIRFINCAAEYDKKIIIEEAINAKEIECAVLGNEEVNASILGEILPAEDYYTFDSKYNNQNSRTKAPSDLSENMTELLRKYAIKAFKALDGKGLSRVDFFVDIDNNNVYLNEINTLPGFTANSMYPQLFEKSGLSYSDLLDKLIELAF